MLDGIFTYIWLIFMVNVGKYTIPWELNTLIFRGYNPYIGDLKPSFFHGFLGSLGVHGSY